MKAITVHILNPKAEKMLNEMADLDLISIDENSSSANWYDDEEYVKELERDLELYEQGKLITYSKEEVFNMISKRKKSTTKEKITK